MIFKGFLINPEKIVLHMGKTHIALEYYGNEILDEIKEKINLQVQVFDYTKDEDNKTFIEKVLGIKFDYHQYNKCSPIFIPFILEFSVNM